ncbi:hypothetical protein ACIO6T_31105 [Streptomyces sp. NPDC087532]|uniref:hypothetical protein n=1 Tax=Streptomyces sp. NPDC087532 TaxID=3365795 RepID=UPI0037FC86A9
MPDLTILQAVIDATGEDDRETVLDVLNEYRLAVDPAASDPDPLTAVDTGRVYATRTTTDTGELLAAALLDTTHDTAFTITQYPTDADNGLYIAHTPQDGTRRAQCNAHGTPVAPIAPTPATNPPSPPRASTTASGRSSTCPPCTWRRPPATPSTPSRVR